MHSPSEPTQTQRHQRTAVHLAPDEPPAHTAMAMVELPGIHTIRIPDTPAMDIAKTTEVQVGAVTTTLCHLVGQDHEAGPAGITAGVAD